MPNHKYEDLWFPLPAFDYKQIKTPAVRKLMRSFHKKVFHVHNMIEFPSNMVGLAIRDSAMRWKLRTEHVLHGETVNLSDSTIDAIVRGMMTELMVQEVQSKQDYEKARELSFMLFLEFVRRFKVISEVQGIYIGMILSAWAAIEVTHKELYAAVVNSSALALANSTKPVNSDGKRINQKQLDRRRITTFSAKKPKDGVVFTSLIRTREAYSMLFDIDHRLIDAALSSLHLDSLALIRNLFVHNALAPDKGFRDSGENIPTLRRFMKPTCKAVKINGRFTRLLVHRAFIATDKLILAADKWLQKHK